MKNFFLYMCFGAVLVSCNAFTGNKSSVSGKPTEASVSETPVVYGPLDTATFAAGCFWCVEAVFESLHGVKEAVSGYAGGHTANPTYEQVCSHTTGHTETVQVFYDPSLISYQTLLEVYFGSMDPTQVNGQGPDNGDSYRSVIFYHDAAQRDAATAYKEKLGASGIYKAPIAVNIQPFTIFYRAEDYHQNYEKNHPENPYVQRVSIPRLERMKAKFPTLLKEKQAKKQ